MELQQSYLLPHQSPLQKPVIKPINLFLGYNIYLSMYSPAQNYLFMELYS